MLRNNRRYLLKVAASLLAGFPLAGSASRPDLPQLSVFVDILIPRDFLSGSATDYDVHLEILALCDDSPQLMSLINAGADWLNQTGSVPFEQLPQADQLTVVQWMSDANPNELPGRFFMVVRQLAVEIYYSDARAWNGLAIDHPPQPQGFMPPWT